MKQLTGIMLAAVIWTSAVRHPSYSEENTFCGIQNNAFRQGEVLTYKVFYNLSPLWVAAGEASFTTSEAEINGHKVYHVVGTGSSFPSYEWIYKVRDRYESFIDSTTMLPVRFIRNVNEGSYHLHQDVLFDFGARKATTEKGVYDIPNCIQDVISAVYYARSIDYNAYQPGTKIPFTMFLDNEVYHLYIRYIGKEVIKTKFGTFNAIKIKPLLIKGTLFRGGEKMEIWVSDDENHVPLRVNSPITVGSIKVDMINYENLRHPLSAQLK